jgi:hypothetical protein
MYVHGCVHAFQGRMKRFRRVSGRDCAGVPECENLAGKASGNAVTASAASRSALTASAASRSARMA